MTELALRCEDHRNVVLVGGGDDFFVLYGSTRLNDRSYASLCRLVDAVAKWKERIGPEHRALCFMTRELCLVNREKRGIDTRHLARAYSDCRAVARKQYRI